MTKEDIKYVITAEDLATEKLRKSAQEVKKVSGQVRQSGERFKASTELAGSFANVLGNANFAGPAGQIAQLTERITAFVGAAGETPFLLKAGAMGAVAFGAFQLGSALGGSWSAAQILNDELERTEQIVEGLARAEQIRFSFEAFEIGLLETTQDKLAAINTEIEIYGNNLSATAGKLNTLKGLQRTLNDENATQVEKIMALREAEKKFNIEGREGLEKAIEEEKKIYDKRLADQTGREAQAEVLRKQEEAAQAKQAQTLKDSAAAFVDGLQKQAKEAEIADAAMLKFKRTRDAIAANKDLTANQRGEAVAAARAILRIDLERKADAEKEKRLAKERAERERIDKLTMSTAENLKIQALQMGGQTADAEAYRLTLQGVDEDTANRLAQLKATLGDLEKPGSLQATTNTAKESRLLSRGSNEPALRMAADAKRTADFSQQQKELLDDIKEELATIAENTAAQAETVGT